MRPRNKCRRSTWHQGRPARSLAEEGPWAEACSGVGLQVTQRGAGELRMGSQGHLESLDSRSRHWDLVPQAMSSSLGCCELESQVLVPGRPLPTLVGWISLGGARGDS